LVPVRPDPRGINHVFTFFAQPGVVTCFQGIQSLLPGHFLRIELGMQSRIEDYTYWEIDFPDRGKEELGQVPRLVDQFEEVLLRSVEVRLRADVPVVSYLSGGVDSGMVAALVKHVRGEPIPAFTIRIDTPHLDETTQACWTARHLGTEPVVIACGAEEVLATYPELIRAAEGPLLDTSCAALLLLARTVHEHGYKVALTGEGADEWLAGYPWYKLHRLSDLLDFAPCLPLSQSAIRTFMRLNGVPRIPWQQVRRIQDAVGGHNAWLPVYDMISLSKLRFFSPAMWEALADHFPYDDLGLNQERVIRWHALNRALYLGAKVMLPGLLLQGKGDRVAMNSSVEMRYPFLDEEVFAFMARLHPRWKLRGLRDKFLLRLVAARWLPREVAQRPKVIFRAPLDPFHGTNLPAFVEQLLSAESLHKTGYFDPAAVHHWRRAFRTLRAGSGQRTSVEMGLAGVVATQLWHHTFIDGSLAELPTLAEATRSTPAAS
jgi:asparagine synthase (glutamine-hydrolysing)